MGILPTGIGTHSLAVDATACGYAFTYWGLICNCQQSFQHVDVKGQGANDVGVAATLSAPVMADALLPWGLVLRSSRPLQQGSPGLALMRLSPGHNPKGVP